MNEEVENVANQEVEQPKDANINLSIKNGRLHVEVDVDAVAGLDWLTKQTGTGLDDVALNAVKPFLRDIHLRKTIVNEKFAE